MLISVFWVASFAVRGIARGRHVVDVWPPFIVLGMLGLFLVVAMPAFVAGMAYHAQHEAKPGESTARRPLNR